jgi:hypothetical protein
MPVETRFGQQDPDLPLCGHQYSSRIMLYNTLAREFLGADCNNEFLTLSSRLVERAGPCSLPYCSLVPAGARAAPLPEHCMALWNVFDTLAHSQYNVTLLRIE